MLCRHVGDRSAALDKEALRVNRIAVRWRAPEESNRVECLILFISGGKDIIIPPFAADAIARVVPRAKVSRKSRTAGRSIYFERAARFNQIVKEFLAAV